MKKFISLMLVVLILFTSINAYALASNEVNEAEVTTTTAVTTKPQETVATTESTATTKETEVTTSVTTVPAVTTIPTKEVVATDGQVTESTTVETPSESKPTETTKETVAAEKPVEKPAQDISKYNHLDFSSKKLIVSDVDNSLLSGMNQSNYDGLTLLQFDSEEAAKLAYARLDGKAGLLIIDTFFVVNTENVTPAATDANAFDSLKTELAEKPSTQFDVAVIDTGSNNDNVVKASMLEDDGSDKNGHGSKTVQLIRQYAPNSKVLSIKALNDKGSGDASAIFAALEYVIQANVKTVVMPFSALSTNENKFVVDKIKEVKNKGITLIASAGNNGTNAKYFIPAGLEEVISIGSAIVTGERQSTSNYGKVQYNVVANSTSEAAAIFTGLHLTGNGNVDNKLVFEPNLITEDLLAVEVKAFFLDNNYVVDKTKPIDDTKIVTAFTFEQKAKKVGNNLIIDLSGLNILKFDVVSNYLKHNQKDVEFTVSDDVLIVPAQDNLSILVYTNSKSNLYEKYNSFTINALLENDNGIEVHHDISSYDVSSDYDVYNDVITRAGVEDNAGLRADLVGVFSSINLNGLHNGAYGMYYKHSNLFGDMICANPFYRSSTSYSNKLMITASTLDASNYAQFIDRYMNLRFPYGSNGIEQFYATSLGNLRASTRLAYLAGIIKNFSVDDFNKLKEKTAKKFNYTPTLSYDTASNNAFAIAWSWKYSPDALLAAKHGGAITVHASVVGGEQGIKDFYNLSTTFYEMIQKGELVVKNATVNILYTPAEGYENTLGKNSTSQIFHAFNGNIGFIDKVNVNLIKQSSNNPAYVLNNNMYSLAGAVYRLYNSRIDAIRNINHVYEFGPTAFNGQTAVQDVKVGTYYMKELVAPKGHVLMSDVTEVIVDKTSTAIRVQDPPLNDPFTLVMKKVNDVGEESDMLFV